MKATLVDVLHCHWLSECEHVL